MKLRNTLRFYEEADDTGGGAVEEPTRGAAVFQTPKTGTGERPLPEPKEKVEKQEEEPTSGEPPTNADEPPVAPAVVDAAKLAKELGNSLAAALKDSKSEEKPQLTPEEAKKLLKVWEPDDEWYKRYDNLDTRKQAVAEMRDALVQQADTLAMGRLHEVKSSLEKTLAPVIEYMQRQQDEQTEKQFGEAYPQLARKEFRPIILAVANDLRTKGTKFDSVEELHAALAKGVEAVMQQSNPAFKLTAGSTPAKPKGQQNANAIPVTTPGSGGGGGGKGGDNKTTKPRGLAIFDNK